jgi:arsenate reductase
MSEPGAITLFGIPNCDQVRKARAWLAAQSIDHVFHDVKKAALPAGLLHAWIDSIGWERLVNRQGTTWRKLDPARQAAVTDADAAILLLQEYPSIMKRPVLQTGEGIEIGFDPLRYQSLLHSPASA